MPQRRGRLLRWYRLHRRDLPWRHTRDPYRIWISEIMLQQTRVAVALPYYERFVQLFPDVDALARASLSEVLRAWSGLGYYQRARHLHAAAGRVMSAHGGRIPAERAALRALPGVGRYTAGAILSLAYGQPEPIVDGNAARVLARCFGIETPIDSQPGRERLWALAARWAATRAPGEANQALMELGATVCTPTPDCRRCPLARDCDAQRSGRERELPRARRSPRGRSLQMAAALLRCGTRLLLVRREQGRLLQDWWELPVARLEPPSRAARLQARKAGELLQRVLHERLRVAARDLLHLATIRHGILAHRLEVEVFYTHVSRAETVCVDPGSRRSTSAHTATQHASRRRATPLASLDLAALEPRWVQPDECRDLPLSTLARKALRAASGADPSWADYLGGLLHEQRGHPRRAHRAR